MNNFVSILDEDHNHKKLASTDPTPEHQQLQNGRLRQFIVIIVIASLIWGFVGSVELFILSSLQTLFPTRTNFQYSIMQIIIYMILLIFVIYLTDFDASSLFVSGSGNRLHSTNKL